MEWTSKQELELSNLYDVYGNNYSEIIREMNEKFDRDFSFDSVRNKIRRSSIIDYVSHKRGKGIFEDLRDNEQVSSYTEAIGDIKYYQKYFNEKYKDAEILVISDLHVPFVDIDALEEVIFNNQDADICVIAGDLLDYHSISSFGQQREISVEKEYKILFKIMKKIAEIFDEVVVINGNHENRLHSYFSHKVVTALSGYLADKHKPLEEVTRFFDNVFYINHWYTQIFDVLFAHPSRYSKVKMRTVRNVVRNRTEKLHEKEFGEYNTVLIGHTHTAGITEFQGKTACEIGCMEQLDVPYRDKDAKGANWVHAYARVSVKNHKTNWNSVQVYRV